jgi:hypothetical protein
MCAPLLSASPALHHHCMHHQHCTIAVCIISIAPSLCASSALHHQRMHHHILIRIAHHIKTDPYRRTTVCIIKTDPYRTSTVCIAPSRITITYAPSCASLLHVPSRMHHHVCTITYAPSYASPLYAPVVFALQIPRSGSQRSSTSASTAGTSCVSQALRCYIVSVCV